MSPWYFRSGLRSNTLHRLMSVLANDYDKDAKQFFYHNDAKQWNGTHKSCWWLKLAPRFSNNIYRERRLWNMFWITIFEPRREKEEKGKKRWNSSGWTGLAGWETSQVGCLPLRQAAMLPCPLPSRLSRLRGWLGRLPRLVLISQARWLTGQAGWPPCIERLAG